MDILSVIDKLETLTPERRKALAERQKSNTLTAADKEELKTHIAMAIVKRKEQKFTNEIIKEEVWKKS